jgi:hypothetical protein
MEKSGVYTVWYTVYLIYAKIPPPPSGKGGTDGRCGITLGKRVKNRKIKKRKISEKGRKIKDKGEIQGKKLK